jgi:hypothetical protein
MPIHDWTKVDAGIFHHFHGEWVRTLGHALNAGILPPDYYALTEQDAVGVEPDVLTLRDRSGDEPGPASTLVAVAPQTRFTAELGSRAPRRKNRVAVRHVSDDTVVAVVEIVSPGNKDSKHAIRAFVAKAVDLLAKQVHLLVIDLHPPTKRDPRGIHAAIQEELTDEEFTPPADKPLTLASYEAGIPPRAYVEPVAVGDVLPDMPLFLVPGGHVRVPLERTYMAAWEGVPLRWRRVIAPEG